MRAARRKIFEACNEHLDALLDRCQEREKLDEERIMSDGSAQSRRNNRRSKKIRR